MSALTIQDIILTMIQIMVLVPIIFLSVKMMLDTKNGLIPVFFAFAMVSFLLSDLYYIIYDILRPDTRIPFAADEIADCAMILLLSAGLEQLADSKGKAEIASLIFSVLFIGANIILWIIWSGEWMQDIVFGLPYVYYLYRIMTGLIRSKAMTKKEIWAGVISCAIILILMFVSVYINEEYLDIADAICFIAMTSFIVWIFVKSLLSFKDKTPGRFVFLSHTLFLSSILMMYASANAYYNIASGIEIVTIPIMFLAIKKELSYNGIR